MFGRVGVISAANRRKRQEAYKLGKSREVELSEKDYNQVEAVINQYEESSKELVFYNVPVL